MLKWLAFAALLALSPTAAAARVPVVELHGAISPASSVYLSRALREATTRGAPLVIIRIDTPGGLESAMREMIRDILASPVPVATYVAPSGARAASAGTYIVYASHIAAMAPGTNIGAATPIQIGIGGGEPSPRQAPPAPSGGKPAEAPVSAADAEHAKAMHDAAAFIRSLAQLRGRNAAWAEAAVTRAQSASASEALKLKVIDLVADGVPDLLRKLDGRSVRTADGMKVLQLRNAEPYAVEPDWRSRLLAVVADPGMALILMMLGIYGLIFEFYSPGLAFPGVIGAICLLLAFYGLHLLPVNYVGVLLVLLGAAFMLAEAFFPTFGALGIGGVAAFVAGALMLVDSGVPGLNVTWTVIVPLALVSAGVLFAIGAMAVRARRRPSVAGAEGMVGDVVEALEDFDRSGWVRADGETWRAVSSRPMKRGAAARIVRIAGLTLEIEPLPAAGRENGLRQV